MNHNPSGDKPNIPPSSRAVVEDRPHQLSLQQALNCLDIKLEDELAKFRAKQPDFQQDVPAMAASTVAESRQFGSDEDDSAAITAEIMPSEITPPSFATAEDSDNSRSGFIIIDGVATPNPDLTAITAIEYAPQSNRSADVSATYESLDLNFSRGGEMTSFHDEYSASSQELLRQIQSGYTTPPQSAEPEPQTAPKSGKRQFLTPLKVGSLAAAFVLAGGATYTYYNPAILAPLTATKVAAPTATTIASSLGQVIQSPNLAASEFSELNLSTINTAKIPTVATAPTASQTTPAISSANPGAPVAIPFTGMKPSTVAPVAITAQPRLADSLVKSLLPPNFHVLAKQTRYSSTP
jgi:hypothetical protein